MAKTKNVAVLKLPESDDERDAVLSRLRRNGIQVQVSKGPGRPRIEKPEGFDKAVDMINTGEITATEAASRLGISRTTFYKIKAEKP